MRILIVDDNEMLANYLVDLFDSLPDDIETQIANGGQEAFHKVDEFKPDVVLLDILMPAITGFEVCRRIKNNPKTSHIKIISMTGIYDQAHISQILEAGADACLSKPIDKEALLKALGLAA